jgi:multiple sugar transport system permease protein
VSTKTKKRSKISSTTLAPYIFITSPMLSIVVLVAFPVLYALYISFFKWHFLSKAKPFIGLTNYINVLKDPLFHTVLGNTVYFAVVYVATVTLLGLALAIIVNSLRGPLRPYMRAVCFVPVVTSMVAVSIVWIWIYEPTFGLLNYLLGLIGLGPYRWLINPDLAMNSIIMMTVWKQVGFIMVIFMAGLVGIPRVYYEAGLIDGTTPWQAIWYITLPLLKNVTVFILVTGVIGAFQVFTQTYVMTGGGPGTATRTAVLEIYLRGFRFLRMGEASAMAFVLFGIIFFVTILQLKYFKAEITY